MTSESDPVLHGKKDRPRLIWSPAEDTFGVLAMINYQILQVISRVPGFSYKMSPRDYMKKFQDKTCSVVDMDASANDAHQHWELKQAVQNHIVLKLWDRIRNSLPDLAP